VVGDDLFDHRAQGARVDLVALVVHVLADSGPAEARGRRAITRGYRWCWEEVLDARALARLASLESATFGNEPVPSEPPSRARTGARGWHTTP
jgi:hypothetical protein